MDHVLEVLLTFPWSCDIIWKATDNPVTRHWPVIQRSFSLNSEEDVRTDTSAAESRLIGWASENLQTAALTSSIQNPTVTPDAECCPQAPPTLMNTISQQRLEEHSSYLVQMFSWAQMNWSHVVGRCECDISRASQNHLDTDELIVCGWSKVTWPHKTCYCLLNTMSPACMEGSASHFDQLSVSLTWSSEGLISQVVKLLSWLQSCAVELTWRL